MILNNDYRDILQALHDERAEFILVGAYALAAHGYPRATMDIDIWVCPSEANACAVLRALSRFGAPLQGLTAEDLCKDDTIFQIGVAPCRIDIITGATGLKFEGVSANCKPCEIDGIPLKILSVDDLITNKSATGRPKDTVDVIELKKLKLRGQK